MRDLEAPQEIPASGAESLRILVTTHVVPWPLVTGTSIRIAHTVRALARLGTVDLACVVEPDRVEGRTIPETEPVSRTAIFPRPRRPGGRAGRLRWAFAGRHPWKLARDYRALQEHFLEWARPPYDLVWLGRGEGFAAFADLVDAPAVCDLDDLEDRKADARLRLAGDERHAGHPRLGARAWPTLRSRVDVRRWQTLHERMARNVEILTVCSDLDARRLDVPNVEVLPNVYPDPEQPAGRLEVGETPTLLFVGLLTYEPNIDALRFLVDDVLPRLRSSVPSLELRAVGSYDDRVADLEGVPGVTLVGWVPEIASELHRADLVTVPIRFGGGTRVKLLEAFAHRLPVVSTSRGAEGLGAVDGTHILIADTADAFARACERALSDHALRGRLTDAAHDLWSARFRPEAMEERVAAIAQRALARGRPGTG